jgi:hypothetical protein
MIWDLCVNVSHPNGFSGVGSGTEGDPYIITNVYQLQEMNYDLSAWYELGNDIDATDTVNWNGGAGFKPIAQPYCENPSADSTCEYNSYYCEHICGSVWHDIRFMGHFNGNGHIITNLYIYRPDQCYVGLFGSASPAAIINVGIVNSNITGGRHYVGGLAGHAGTIYGGVTIRNCYFEGSIHGGGAVGGLVGLIYHNVSIDICYTKGSVYGYSGDVGGLLGFGWGDSAGNSIVSNSYSTANVTGEGRVGGLLGAETGIMINCYAAGCVSSFGAQTKVGGLTADTYQGSASNCFWDIEATGQNTSALGEGKMTVDMKHQATFANWDFDTVWGIMENETYPFLRGTPEEPVVISFLETVPLSWISANRIDISANLDEPTIKSESYVLTTSAPGIQVSCTKYPFNENGSSVNWPPATNYVADQVAKNDLFAIANPLTGLAPLHCVRTISIAEGSLRVDATGGLTSTNISVDIWIPATAQGFGSTIVDHPEALLEAIYQAALVYAGAYGLVAFNITKNVIAENIESITGIEGLRLMVAPFQPGDEIDCINALFKAAVLEAIDKSFYSEFGAIAIVNFSCPLAQVPGTGWPLGRTGESYGYPDRTQGPSGRFEKSGTLRLQRVIEIPTNTDVPYTIEVETAADCWGIAQAIAHTKGYNIRFTELSTGKYIDQNAVVLNPPQPEIWRDPESFFQFDAIGDVHAMRNLQDSQGVPVITPKDGSEFVIIKENSPAIYSTAFPLGLDANNLSVDLDILLTGPLSGPSQKKLAVQVIDDANNSIELLNKDLIDYTYEAFGPAEGFTLRTGFSTVSADVSTMSGKNITLVFLLIGDSNDPVRAGVVVDNIQGFAAPVARAITADLDDSGKVDFNDFRVFAERWLNADCNEPTHCGGADFDLNGIVDWADFKIFADGWLQEKIEPILGDFNRSGCVDFIDFMILANHWMGTCVDPHWCDGSDLDKSGFVDVYDLSEFANHWLEGTNP